MAMIKCPECKTEISDKADSCPKCGYSLAKDRKKKQQSRNAAGCLVLMIVIFGAMFSFCSNVEKKVEEQKRQDAAAAAAVEAAKPKKELTEEERYKENIRKCIGKKSLTYSLETTLKESLKNPKSYDPIEILCDYPKDGEKPKQLLHCIQRFRATNSFNAVDVYEAKLLVSIPMQDGDWCGLEIVEIK